MVFIYAIQLEQGKFYIGKTNNPQFRLESHFNSKGSVWTKLYKPLRVLEIKRNCDDYDEDKITIQYMDKYGINNVRGGSFVTVKLEKSMIDALNQMKNGTNDKCFVCGKKGHFAKECSNKNKSYDCPNKLNPYHQCNDYCNRKYQQEIVDEEYENEDDNYDNFKNEFLRSCKKIDKEKTKILMADNILKILNNNNYIDFGILKLTNIFGLCQTIHSCDLEYSVGGREGIGYEYFIEGLIYILKNDPEICDRCDCEIKICSCRKYKKSTSLTCYRCGRKGHLSPSCYASTHIKGYCL